MTLTRTPKSSLPDAQNWDNFWGLDQTRKFTQVSWSKRRIMGILSKYTAKGKKALDAGCGCGFFSKYFCDQGMATVALDYSPKALEIARQMTQGRVKVIQSSLLGDDLPLRIEDRFDVVFTDGLLEHFVKDDQDKILTNLRLLLAKDGHIVTVVPNRFSPWELIRPFYMPGIEEKPFTLKELVDLHERNDFEVQCKGGTNTFPFACSPDPCVGHIFGMLLFVVAKHNE